MSETLSIIIPSYDRPEITKIHVRECMESTRMPDEIIVVNDAGDPALREMLLELDFKCKVVYARINEDIAWNYTGARNLGVFLSQGDFLSVEDVDNIPSDTAYASALAKMKDEPEFARIMYGKRVKITSEVALTWPREKWREFYKKETTRAPHQDTQMLRRDLYLTVKGCDERFAGRYAWACSDWRRRLMRAGFQSSSVSDFFISVYDAETHTLLRRKSYKNYEMASGRKGYPKDHTQSPIGMLNFTYEYEIL